MYVASFHLPEWNKFTICNARFWTQKKSFQFRKSLAGIAIAAQFQQTKFERLQIEDHIERSLISDRNVFKIQ